MPQNTYVRTMWVNDSDPPLDADNLNKIEQGVVDAHIHMSTKSNPHSVTTEQIGAATEANLNAHIDDEDNPHSVTTDQIGAATEANLDAHIDDKDNPHSVTTEQIGAATKVEHDAHKDNENNPHEVTHIQTSPEGAKIGADVQRDKHVSDADFSNWEEHRGDQSNPHEVTHDQTAPGAVDLTSENIERNKHISNKDGKRWEDHVNHPNPHSNHETPAGAQSKVDAHATRTDNPHNLTAVQIGAVDLSLLTAHETNATMHVTPEQRASLDHSEYPPTAENPIVTSTELYNAMSGSTRSAVGSVTELAAIPPAQRTDRDMRLVEDEGKIYRFDTNASEGDVPPDEGDGYWIIVSSATQSHNNLTGLQGGDANLSQYYHLNRDDYNSLTEHYERLNNPHEVTAVQTGAIATINGVPNLSGDISIVLEGSDLEVLNNPETHTILLINNHNERLDNPHNVRHDQVYPLSVEYGTDVARDKHLSNADYARWEDHRDSETNPHNVTAVQTGALVSINGVAGSNGDILVVYEGGDLETISDPTSGVVRFINNHNERLNNPHEVRHDQVEPVPVEYGPDETRDKHLSNADYSRWEEHRVATTAHGATPNATAERTILRDANGRAKVADPLADQDIATKKYVDDQVGTISGVPSGVITMWSGAIANIPSGWALCNGSNGTPDLRDRFIVGAGGAYSVGDTGGSQDVVLSESQMPIHNHAGSSDSTGAHTHDVSTVSAGEHTHEYQCDPAPLGDGMPGMAEPVASNGTIVRNTELSGEHTHAGTAASAGAHTHAITVGNAGSGEAHENRPPYYALAYIMKL